VTHSHCSATENLGCDQSVYDTKCDICSQYCKGQQGLTIHQSKKHKTKPRQDIVDTYVISIKINVKENIDSNEDHNDNHNCNKDEKQKVQNKFKTFWNTMENSFDEILVSNTPNAEMCENLVSIVVDKLKDMQEKLPGPQNPISKYFKMRKSQNFQNVNRKYKQSSNPERQTKRDKQRREIPQDPIPSDIQDLLNSEYDDTITKEEINAAIKKTENDSAPGPDYIIPRTLKVNANLIAPTMPKLGTYMLKWTYVPN